MNPRTTILTTFRDAAPFLATSVRSLQAQRRGDFRVILLDDGSQDDWWSVVEPLIEKDDRFEVLVDAPRGRRAALAKAHEHVRTEFVAWLDADDWLHPNALARTESFLDARPEVGMVFTDSVRIDGEGRSLGHRHRSAWSRSRQLVEFSTFHFRLIRQSAFIAAGGISDLEIGIDYDLALRLAEVTRFAHLAEPLYHYRVHAAQMSSRKKGAQMQASALAVRRAIERRQIPATTFRLKNNRFTLRVALDDAPPTRRERARVALASCLEETRPRPKTATVWPSDRRDFVATALQDGLHRCGTALTRAGTSIEELARCAKTGRLGEVLLLHRVAAMLGNGGRRRAIELGMLLSQIRIRGVRVVWCRWADGCDPRIGRIATRILRWSVDHVIDPEGADSTALGQVCAMGQPDISEFVPHMHRGFARRRLGLEKESLVLLCLVAEADEDRVEEELRGLGDPRACFLLPGAASSRQARPSARPLPTPRTSRSLATLIAACDAVVVGPSSTAYDVALSARAAGRPVFAAPSHPTPRRDCLRELTAEGLAAVRTSERPPPRAAQPCPAIWAAALLGAL